MLKFLILFVCILFIENKVASQPCTATITPNGLTTFCNGGSVILNANTGANTWTQKSDFGGTARNAYAAFSIGSKGYIGTGYNGSQLTNDFWEYEPASDTWTQKANFGGTARRYAVGFCIGSKGYIGTGYDGSYRKDFWEYDPINNTWIQKTDFAGSARDLATGFAIGTKGYIGTGNDGGYKKDFWEYDPTNNSWTQKTDFGGSARNAATGLFIGGKGYIGMGFDGSYKKDFWEYNPANNTWTQKTDFGGSPRNACTSFSIGTKGYMGMGFDGGYKKDIWEFDQNTNTWTQKADFGGNARNAAISFSINGSGYVGLGFDGSYKKDFWQYNPALTYLWSNGATTPSITVNSSGSYSVIVTNTATGCSATSTSTIVTVNNTMGIASISAAANPICINTTTILTANGVTGSNAVVTWWTSPGGVGTNLGTGITIPNVGPGTYYARITGDCNPVETSIVIMAKSNVGMVSASAAESLICSNSTTTLSINGVTGTNATVNWWTGTGATGTNLGTGPALLNAGPGNYYAYVTGDCGSPVEALVSVNSKVNAGILSVTGITNPLCSNSTTTITANGITGTNALVTWWSGPGGTGSNLGFGNSIPNVPPGTYYAVVAGDCGSPAEASLTITGLPATSILSATAASNPICSNTTTNLTANGVVGSNATVTWWSAPGGTGTNLGTGTTLLNTAPGIYYARVTGDCGLPAETMVTVQEKLPSSSSLTASNCISYTWHGTVYKSSGNYTYTTTNAVGCDSVVTLHLTIFSTITSTYTKKDAACNTVSTGSITINPTKGNAPFTFRIGTTGSYTSSNTFNSLSAGLYRISILDVNGCTGTSAQITIVQQTTITGIFTKKDATCNNILNGSIIVTPTSGTAPFVYKYGTAGSYVTDSILGGLGIGDYRVYLQDVNGCNINTSLTINQPLPVTVTAAITNTKCIGATNGSITATPNSGFSPFTYKLNTTVTYQTSNKFLNLKAGVYTLFLKDKNGCIGYTSATVGQPVVMSAIATKTDALCPGSATGSLIITPSGGTPPYTYRLGSTGTFVTTNTFNNLKPGSYRVYIIDANGCSGFSIAATIGTQSANCTPTIANKMNVEDDKAITTSNYFIYPNPTTNNFNIRLAIFDKPIMAKLLDVNGHVLSTFLTRDKQILNFGQKLLPGLYFIEILEGKKIIRLKAIKI